MSLLSLIKSNKMDSWQKRPKKKVGCGSYLQKTTGPY